MGIPRAQPEDRGQPAGPGFVRGSRHWFFAIAIAGIAFLFRLIPVLRGGGLFGLGNYDDGVYYAAGTAIAHGSLPYRDFLLLHPPGLPLLLTPFALLAQLTNDSYGFAAARVAWMLLGAVNAVLIWRILRPIGLISALFGALSYAVFYPAVYADHTTLLESPATTALLVAILLLEPLSNTGYLSRTRGFAVGAVLGITVAIKIWGVVTVVIVLGWLLLIRRFRAALQVAIGCAAMAGLICLPFFAAAPMAMWHQLVRDQIVRHASGGVTLLGRLDEIVGLGIAGRPHASVTAIAVIALLCCAGLAWTNREARLPVVLLLGQGAFLLVTPIWFRHYAGFTAGPIALVIGAAIGRLIALLRPKPARVAITIAVAGAVLVYASGWSDIHFGRRFPDRFKPLAASATGCVTTDDPTALVETNTLSRNLSRGCRFIADLGGHYHDLAAASINTVSRNKNKSFQRLALTYLSTGSVTILIRFSAGQGFNATTSAILDQWPLLAHSGKYQMRRPVALGQSTVAGSLTPQHR